MSILVTGGAGYIGSNMAHYLCDAGEQVVVLDDLSRGNLNNVPNEAKFYQGDIRDSEFVFNVLEKESITEVIHFAGYISVPESVSDPCEYYSRNTSGVCSLVQACARAGVDRIVFSSTAAVYGEVEGGAACEVSTPKSPISPYGWSKLMAEQVLADARKAYGVRSIALRYFNVAGTDHLLRTGQRPEFASHLIKIASEVAVGKRDRLHVFGSDYPTPCGSCVRDYVHVVDLVEAHMNALRCLRDGHPGGEFNVGYGQGFSVFEVISIFEELLGRKLPHIVADRRPGDPPMLIAKPDRIFMELGWRPKRAEIKEIVRSAIEWECRIHGVDFDEIVASLQAC